MNRKPILIIIVLSLIYITIVYPYIDMPPMGIHAWNEALISTFLRTIVDNNNPFLLYSSYDINTPDFNVGYIYFWANYGFIKLFNLANYHEPLNFRIISIFSTLFTMVIFYLILKEFNMSELAISIILILYILSPLVLYFGWKAQLEPLLILLFLISQLFLIRYIKYGDNKYLYVSCIIMGILIVSRSNFIVFVPLYMTIFVDDNYKMVSLRKILPISVAIALGMIITLAPSSILYPQFDPLIFFYKRIFEAGTYAFSAGKDIKNIISTFINDALWKQMVSIFPLSILSIILIKKIKISKLRFYFLLATLLTWAFFSLTYIHTANHIYQVYYGIFWLIIASCMSIDYIIDNVKKYNVYIIIFFIVSASILLSFYYLIAYYGLYTNNVYNKIDAYGTYESWIVGNTLRYVLNETKEDGYLLVQSPTVYYPARHPSITYYDTYKWDSTNKSYSYYSFFEDQKSFINEIKKRKIGILTMTPDVYANSSKKFKSYKDSNFVDICYTKNFVISLNKTDFINDTSIKMKCAYFLKNLSYNDKLMYKTTYNNRIDLLNISLDKIQNFENFSNINQTIEFKSKIDLIKTNFTIFSFLYVDNFRNDAEIISNGNVWKVKFGEDKDIFFTAPETVKGYAYTDGIYYSPYLYIPTCLTFGYSNKRISVYINGIKKSEEIFPDIITSNDSIIIGNNDIRGKIKVLILDEDLGEDDIGEICSFKKSDYRKHILFEN